MHFLTIFLIILITNSQCEDINSDVSEKHKANNENEQNLTETVLVNNSDVVVAVNNSSGTDGLRRASVHSRHFFRGDECPTGFSRADDGNCLKEV